MRVKYWHVCMVSLLAGVIQLGLLILICAMKAWVVLDVTIKGKDYTFYVGVCGTVTGKLFSYNLGGYKTLIATLILSMLVVSTGIVFQALSWAKRTCGCCAAMGFMRLCAVMYLISDVLLIIGLIEYDINYWKTKIPPNNVTWHYYWAFILGWIMSILFLIFILARAVFVNFILDMRKLVAERQDREELVPTDNSVPA